MGEGRCTGLCKVQKRKAGGSRPPASHYYTLRLPFNLAALTNDQCSLMLWLFLFACFLILYSVGEK